MTLRERLRTEVDENSYHDFGSGSVHQLLDMLDAAEISLAELISMVTPSTIVSLGLRSPAQQLRDQADAIEHRDRQMEKARKALALLRKEES